MSRKLGRLRGRLRIECERNTKERRRLSQLRHELLAEKQAIEATRKDLNRSVALRMRVQRDFMRPMGDAWALNIVFYPDEYRYQFLRSDAGRVGNASLYAERHGYEAGQQITEVIKRCLAGELREFEKVG